MAITTRDQIPPNPPRPSMTLRMELLPGVAVELALVRLMDMANQLREIGIELSRVMIELPHHDAFGRYQS